MAVLNLTPEEFADIVLLFLADKAVNPEKVVTGNEPFNTFMRKNAQQIKGKLLKYYLDSDPQRRLEYKLIKKIFKEGAKGQMGRIRIGSEKQVKGIKQEKKKAKGIIKKLVNKLLLKKENINNKEDLEFLLEFVEEE